MTNRCIPVLFLVVLVSGGCGSQSSQTLPAANPTGNAWVVASPAEVGADASLLAAMIREIKTGDYVNIHSVLVVKDGRLVVEEYFDGHDRKSLHEIRSATKSIGSILTGIAIDNGFVQSETDPIHAYFENDYAPSYGWDRRSRQVEIRDLLSMMSGYDCDDLATDFACEDAMYGTDDWVQYALDLPFAHDPGQHWAYNSSSLILVGEAIARGSGLTLDEFAERYLFEPLGIRGIQWNISPKGRAWIGGGARMTPREMAKTGQMMLNGGLWNGKRILSKEWIDKSTARQGEMHSGVDYGYLWQSGEAVFGNRMIRGYWASGNGGQYIIVLPDDAMVAVFTGGNYNDPLANQPFRMLLNNIVPAFLPVEPLEEIILGSDELQRLVGVYELDFERAATSTISVHEGRLRALTPDEESVDLIARSPTHFTGDSQHGPVSLIFEGNGNGEIVRFVARGAFSRFTFERR
jgi:CubicO group peptidase (beta-lactamase class C family)